MNNKKVLITVGVSASGKSTWASNYVKTNPNSVEVNRDNLRAVIFENNNPGQTFSWKSWKWAKEKEVDTLQKLCFQNFIQSKELDTLIISDTNLNPKTRKHFLDYFSTFGYDVFFIDFEISFEDAISRDAARPNPVGITTIAKQFDKWYEYKNTKIYTDQGLPKCAIVDVDGTLAHMVGRNPYDLSMVKTDKIDENVKTIVNILKSAGNRIIIFSGREDVAFSDTVDWLIFNGVMFDEIYLRATGDNRSDEIVKKEFFVDYILNKYDVLAVIDDRPKVCRMWRSIGLKTLQVGNPHIEF